VPLDGVLPRHPNLMRLQSNERQKGLKICFCNLIFLNVGQQKKCFIKNWRKLTDSKTIGRRTAGHVLIALMTTCHWTTYQTISRYISIASKTTG
jgi:hypothetical protein